MKLARKVISALLATAIAATMTLASTTPASAQGDTTPPTMEAIVEAQGQYYNTAPTFSNFRFDDNVALDDGWYQMDSYSGNWTALFTDVADVDVNDFAVASDNATIYVADGALGRVYKSTDTGQSFTRLAAYEAIVGVSAPTAIAVASDNASAIAITDGTMVYYSNNGGTTWTTLPALPTASANATITDIAVGPARAGTVLGREYAIAAADPAAGATNTANQQGDVLIIGAIANWDSAAATTNITGDMDYMAVAFTPNFVGDRGLVAVGSSATFAKLQIINTNLKILAITTTFGTTTIDYDGALAAASSIVIADIALPSDYDPTTGAGRRSYACIASVAPNTDNDVYRIDNATSTALGAVSARPLKSLAYNGTIYGGTLFTGYNAATAVKYTSNPTGTNLTITQGAPSGSNTTVVRVASDFATTNRVFAGASGTGSAFSVSNNGGESFSDLSLAGTDISDFAVASDNNTIYVADGGLGRVYKSTDTGQSFTRLTVYEAIPGVGAPTAIAVASDNASAIAVTDGAMVYYSNNGGTTWTTLPALPTASANATITDVAVGPARAGILLGREYAIAVADPAAGATNTAGAQGDVLIVGATAAWRSAGRNTGITGGADYMAVAFTPNFIGDRCLVAVGASVGAGAIANGIYLHLLNDATGLQVLAPTGLYTAAASDYRTAAAAGTDIVAADIALPSNYDATTGSGRRAYVTIATFAAAIDDVFRIDNTTTTALGATNRAYHSCSYSGTIGEGTLFTGDRAATTVRYTSNPLGTALTATQGAPSGSNTTVVRVASDFATTNRVFAGASGAGSAFSVSNNGGESFSDLSLAGTDISDFAVASDNNTIYVADGGLGRVYKSTDTGQSFTRLTAYEAIPSVGAPTAIEVASDNASAIAVTDGAMVYYSNNGGTTWTTLPALPVASASANITDVAVGPARAGTILGREYAIAVADPAAGATNTANQQGDVLIIGAIANWASAGIVSGITGTNDYMAVAFTPYFVEGGPINGDRCLVVVGSSATFAKLQIFNTAIKMIVRTTTFGTTTIDYDGALAGANSILTADIALPSDFDPTTGAGRRSYACIASVAPNTDNGVYRIDNAESRALGVTNRAYHSCSYSGTIDEGTLFTGDRAATTVWYTSNPTWTAGTTWTTTQGAPSGTNATVVRVASDFATTNRVFAGTSGADSTFSVSNNGGESFNDVRLAGTLWDSDNWTIPGFAALGEGSHTIYFKASDDTGNVEGESGEWSWQFFKGTPSPSVDGGDGDTGAIPQAVTKVGSVDLTPVIDEQGVTTADIVLTSPDGEVTMMIPAGTQVLDAEGNPIGQIEIVVLSTPPTPASCQRVCPAYDCLPNGVTFAPPIDLTFDYKPANVPAGVNEADLAMAWWDGNKWIFLDTTVDTTAKTVTAKVSHFTPFTIFAKLPPPPKPAAFSIGNLHISPTEVDIGETVTIKTTVNNTGGSPGTYDVLLKINDNLVTHELVSLAPGASQAVTFTTSKRTAGTYTVNVNGQSGKFVVKGPPAPTPKPAPKPAPAPPAPKPAPPTPPEPLNWWLVGGIVSIIVVVIPLIYRFVRRRRKV